MEALNPGAVTRSGSAPLAAGTEPASALPLLTLVLAAAALLLSWHPALCGLLQLERAGLARGELWRVLTGHLVHFSGQHLLYDVATLIGLGFVCERRAPRLTRAVLLVAAPLIAVVTLASDPQLETYRGLSGLDSALFALLAVLLWREWRALGDRRAWLPVVALLGFAAKLGYELLASGAVFVDTGGAFRPVPVAHLVGGAVGVVGGVLGRVAE